MPRVLVAGGTGFLGRAFVRGLHRRGTQVAVLTRNADGALALGLPAECVEADVRRPGTLAPAMDGVDAAILSVQFPGYPVEAPALGRTFMEVDAHGTAALVEAAVRAGVRKLVYLSGVGADPHSPRTWYCAKGLAEASVRDSGLDYVIVRPSWVYGPEDRSLNRFIAILRRIPFVFPQLGDGSGRITPIHVDDLADLVCEATLGAVGDGLTLEAGGPDIMSLDDVVRTAMALLGRRRAILHVPIGFVRLAAAVAEVVPGQILSRDAVHFVTQDGIADSELAHSRFPAFRPRGFGAGLAEYVSRT